MSVEDGLLSSSVTSLFSCHFHIVCLFLPVRNLLLSLLFSLLLYQLEISPTFQGIHPKTRSSFTSLFIAHVDSHIHSQIHFSLRLLFTFLFSALPLPFKSFLMFCPSSPCQQRYYRNSTLNTEWNFIIFPPLFHYFLHIKPAKANITLKVLYSAPPRKYIFHTKNKINVWNNHLEE